MTDPDEHAPAGWYPDPYQPGRLRYFDGVEWTDHYHYEGRLPPIGAWFSTTFGVVAQHAAPLFALTAGLGLVGSLMTWGSIRYAVGDVAIIDEEFVNVSGGRLALGLLFLLLAVLWQGFSWLAVNRYLQVGHLQLTPTPADAINRAVSRLPKLVGVYLLLFAAALLILMIVTLFAAVAPLLGLIVVIAMIGAAVWVVVKLSFLTAAIAAAPADAPALETSARVSRGRFWPVLGRLALMFILITVASLVIDGIVGSRGSVVDQDALANLVEVEGDDMRVNDTRLADLLPRSGDFVWYLLISTVVGALTTMVSTSALMRLYLDSGGPSEV